MSTELAVELFVTVQTPGPHSILTATGPDICIKPLVMLTCTPCRVCGMGWPCPLGWLLGPRPSGEFHSGWVPDFKNDIGGHEQEKTRSMRALKLLFL